MPVITDVARQKERISGQLARIDAQRSKLQEELNVLEAAERVLSRFARQRGTTPSYRRRAHARAAGTGRLRRQVAARRMRAARRQPGTPPLGEATLRAVKAHSAGASANEVRDYLARYFGMTVRPNHLGMALQRHRRAGRLEMRGSRWHAPS